MLKKTKRAVRLAKEKRELQKHIIETIVLSNLGDVYHEVNEWCQSFETSRHKWKRISYQVKPLGEYVYSHACYVDAEAKKGTIREYNCVYHVNVSEGKLEKFSAVKDDCKTEWEEAIRMFDEIMKEEETKNDVESDRISE